MEEILQKAKATNEEDLTLKRKKARVYFGALTAVLGAILLVWVFWPQEGPVSTAERETPRLWSSQPSTEPASGREGSSNVGKKREPVAERSAEAKALLDKAVGLVEKNPQEARSLLLTAVELDPRSVQTHFQLGLTCMVLNDSPSAIEAYQKVIQLDPRFADAYFNLGYIYATNRNYSKAEQMYSQVAKLAPAYLDEVLFNLSLVQEKQGKRGQSLENLDRALQINPKNEMARKFRDKLMGNS